MLEIRQFLTEPYLVKSDILTEFMNSTFKLEYVVVLNAADVASGAVIIL